MKFYFEIDKKCTIWVKEFHEVHADNYEQARATITDNFRMSDNDNTFTGQEIQHETLEDILVGENNGWPTAELMDDKGSTIADNTILKK